ncbi:MAG TPA: Hsp20/alpha crystallin family protein [Lachnospiraceae bacterium]|nr:Hsp20/alpha crystallin family protein [Lachnospiraceae bacterium]
MLVPSVFTNNFIDDFFNDVFDRQTPDMFHATGSSLMSTDVKEFDDHYDMELELPGFKKEDIHADLKDGYLTIKAERSENKDEKDEKTGKYIRRERYSGQIERTFYVGGDVTEADIKAGFENGILKVSVPKKEANPKVEEAKHIMIE